MFNDLLTKPLFVEIPEFAKVASYKLSENIDAWDKEIIGHDHEDISFITDYHYEIDFKKLDKNFGYGVGAIKFTSMEDVYIPIIIKKYQLSPLDVMVVGESTIPLNETTFQAVASVKQPLGKLRDPRAIQPYRERQDAQNPDEVNVHPSTKYGSFLDAASGNSIELKKIAKDNPIFLSSYKNNGTMGIFKKALKVPSKKEDVDVQEKTEGKEIEGTIDPYMRIEKAGAYHIADTDNKFNEGALINNVYDFDFKKQAFNLFIGEGKYGYQEKYAGVKCPGGKVKSKGKGKGEGKGKGKGPMGIPLGEKYGSGDNICFVASKGDTHVATVPMTVTSKSQLNGSTKIGAHLISGEPVNLYITPHLKDIVKTAENVYHIPKNKMQIVKLGRYSKFHWNTESIEKQAIAKLSHGNTTTIVRDGTMFSVEGNMKTAGTYTPSELYEVLSPYYNNAIDMIKKAGAKEKVMFSGIKPMKKIASKEFKLPFKAIDLFKVASGLSEPDSVDAVLSLNYINKDNLDSFVELIPKFEEVINSLAKLLLSIRTGLRGNEHAVKNAMNYLQESVETLKSLK